MGAEGRAAITQRCWRAPHRSQEANGGSGAGFPARAT